MQAGFGVEVLALEAQGVVDVGDFHLGDVAVGAVFHGPEDGAAGAGKFLRGAEVVELVVAGLGLLAFALEQGQGAEGAGFVDVAAVMARRAFGDEAFALPEEFGGAAVQGLGDAPATGWSPNTATTPSTA